MAEIPATIRENFKSKFSILNSKVKNKISDLITTFGFVNKNSIRVLLKGDVQLCYLQELERLKLVQKICLVTLIEKTCFDQKAIGHYHLYDHISVHSSKNIEDCVKNDLLKYFSSAELPIQEAKALSGYSLVWMKEFINKYDENLQKAITSLFLWTENINKFSPPPMEQMLLLFKHAGITWCDQSFSFGFLLYLWLHQQSLKSQLHSKLLNWMENVSFFCLLHKSQPRPTSSMPEISFQNFVIENTIGFIFHDETTILPAINSIKEDVKKIFSIEEARQTGLYYINYLHHLNFKKEFSFNPALQILDRLVTDHFSPLYNFLHAILHYFRYIGMFPLPIEARSYLLVSIYALPYQHRKKSQLTINEKFHREPFVIDSSFVAFLSKHFEQPQHWARIFLRQTAVVSGNQICPYLNLNKHIQCIEEIETFIGKPLPLELISDILLLQTVKPNMIKVINKFKTLRWRIEHLHSLSTLNEDFFKKWHKIQKQFIDQIDILDDRNWKKQEMTPRNKIKHISFLLLFAAYPQFKTSVILNLRKIESERNQWNEGLEQPYLTFFLHYFYSLPIEEGVNLLSAFLPDQQSSIYNVLHSLLHYHHAKGKIFCDSEDGKQFLYLAITSMTLEERQKFDQPIRDPYILQPIKINSDLLEFANSHSISSSGWGKIFLRCSRSISMKSVPPKFLSISGHIKFIQHIESFLGTPLPAVVTEDLLYFQVVRENMFEIIEKFSNIREEIKNNCLSWISIPTEICKKCTILSIRVCMEGIANLIDLPHLWGSNERSDTFQEEVIGSLAFLLSFATYPRPIFSFRDSINFEIKDNKPANVFYPLNLRLPIGPALMCRWITHEQQDKYTLAVILTNFSNPHASCLFRVPVKVPQNSEERTSFFSLLISTVDRLGKEVFDEDEEKKTIQLGKCNEITQEILCRKVSAKIHLEELLECSPLIQDQWEQYFSDSNQKEDGSDIDLFLFIEKLRTNFLRSFFYVLNPKEKNLIENNGIETTFCFSDEGINLINPHVNPDWVCIRKEDHYPQFLEIYKEIYNKKNILFSSPSHKISSPQRITEHMTFDLKLYNGTIQDWKGEFEWNGELDSEKNSEDQLILKIKSESIKIATNISSRKKSHPEFQSDSIIPAQIPLKKKPRKALAFSSLESLTIKYAPFRGEEEFMESMLWHVALLYLDLC